VCSIIEAVTVESAIRRERYNIYIMVREHSNNVNNNNDIRYYGNVYWVIVFCRFGIRTRENQKHISYFKDGNICSWPNPRAGDEFRFLYIHRRNRQCDPRGYRREIYTALASMILTTEAKTLDVEQ